MRSSVTKHLCRWALCSVALAVSVVAGTTAWAHIDPPGASQSGAGQRIGLFTDSTCSTSLPGPILSCQTIYVRTTLVWTGGVGSSFEQGAWTLQSNNGVDPPNTFADLIAAQGGPVPCVANPATSTNDPSLPGGRGLCAGKASEFASQCVPYTPTAGDIAQGGATIEALWGNANPSNAGTGYTHRSTNDNAGASATASEFVPITSCPLDQCNVGCVVTAGVAACTFAPDSTACDSTPDIPGDCRTPGCESGVCVATHIPEPDSTACTSTPDIPGDCRTPGCESGVCVATHIPEPDSTACTTTADIPGDCKTPGCESGVCVATHINEPDSTPCTDTGNACFNAGCEAGSCSQTHVAVTCSSDNNSCTDDSCDPVAGCIHTCNPTGKPECSLTIGDYIWNDANHDGIQEPGAGIGGVTISLHDCTTPGSDVTTTTAADGSYSFTVTVNPKTCTFSDNYQITVTDTANVLAGYSSSPADVGSDDAVDSDCVNKQIACQPYTGTDLTEDCGFFKAGPLEVCRTPGFWGTHGGTEKKKSNNITQQVLDQAGGLHVCGHLIDDTDPKPPNFTPTSQSSALEAICVSPQGAQVLQLARQLTAAALNCVMSQGTPLPLGSHADPSICGGTDIATLWTECDDLCAFNGPVTPHGLDIGGCINALDCFNNGGLADATGNCGPNPNGNCHNRDLCQVDASGHPIPGGICYPDPGPAGSSDACNAARDNNCTIIFGHCSHP